MTSSIAILEENKHGVGPHVFFLTKGPNAARERVIICKGEGHHL
jgi:hypothetical protein